MNMRKYNEKINLDYKETQLFFNTRGKNINPDNPYSATMYQDNNPTLVAERNKAEVEKLKPLLQLNENSRILDVACGVGRWADAITEKVNSYFGIDFCADFIKIAEERNSKPNFKFQQMSVNDFTGNIVGDINRILMIGILEYLNECDVLKLFNKLIEVSDEHSLVCIREPVGTKERLTLKKFYSDELKDNYNAIYRNKNELLSLINDTFVKNGFSITKQDWLFDDGLNNRKETRQWFCILSR